MEPVKPITDRPEHSPGRTGSDEVDVFQESRVIGGLCTTQRMKEEEGRGSKPTGSLNCKGYHGSGEEGCWSVDSNIVLALGPFAPRGGSVSCQVGEGGSLLVHLCCRVSNDEVDEEGISTLEMLHVISLRKSSGLLGKSS